MKLDRSLILATLALLLLISGVLLYAIFDYSQRTREDASWLSSIRYRQFEDSMNRVLFPLVVLCAVILGLCIPKRVLDERALFRFNGALLFLAFLLYAIFDYRLAVAFVLAVAALLQGYIVVATLAGRRTRSEGAYAKRLGSALVHLGIVITALDIAMPSWMIIGPAAALWAAAGIVGVGMLLLFYRKGSEVTAP